LLPLWREAQGLNASAETNVELARLLLRRAGAGDRPQAMDLLQRAAGLANPASGGVSYQGEAYYYLSLLGLSDPARNWEDVVRNAALAVQAGGGQFRHRALVCLAHIGRGGPDVRDGRDAVACEVDATPAGELLRGMYFIRQAQLVYTPQAAFDTPVRQRWLVALRSAQSAFDRGLALNPGVATLADWPSLPAETARVEDMLRYGKYIVDFCSSAAAPSNPGVDGRAFFERHSALNCRVG
jgi:hypothetical protein